MANRALLEPAHGHANAEGCESTTSKTWRGAAESNSRIHATRGFPIRSTRRRQANKIEDVGFRFSEDEEWIFNDVRTTVEQGTMVSSSEGNDSKSGLASPDHNENVLGLVLGGIEAKRCNQIFIFSISFSRRGFSIFPVGNSLRLKNISLSL